jgi:hypothetical protein
MTLACLSHASRAPPPSRLHPLSTRWVLAPHGCSPLGSGRAHRPTPHATGRVCRLVISCPHPLPALARLLSRASSRAPRLARLLSRASSRAPRLARRPPRASSRAPRLARPGWVVQPRLYHAPLPLACSTWACWFRACAEDLGRRRAMLSFTSLARAVPPPAPGISAPTRARVVSLAGRARAHARFSSREHASSATLAGFDWAAAQASLFPTGPGQGVSAF